MIGKVEAADGGTLFLDEIGELPLPLQGKLLRFVQERKFERVGGRETLDRRRPPRRRDQPRPRRRWSNAGQFRSDLYFRLRVVEIEIPPLRARGGDDIVDLAEHFVAAVRAPLSQGTAAARRRGAKPALRRVRVARQRARAREHDRARGRARRQGPTIGVQGPRPRAAPRDRVAAASDSLVGMPAIVERRRSRPAATDGVITLPADLTLEEAERRYAKAILERAAATSRPPRARSASAATSSRACSRREPRLRPLTQRHT